MKKINLLIIVLLFLGTYLMLPSLPSLVPLHWNIQGQIDNYAPKDTGVWIMPVLVLVLFILFHFIPSFDPKREKYRLFQREWDIIQTGLIIFFAYMQCIILYASVYPELQIMPVMFTGFGALFILLGRTMSKIKQNYFIGIRVPWTLSSEDNWNKTHNFAAKCFTVAGIVVLLEAIFIRFAPFVVFGSIMLSVFLPVMYSFLLFKKSPEKMKYVYIGLLIIIMIVGAIRLLSGEDDWICQNGQWVKHGNPDAVKPSVPCPR